MSEVLKSCPFCGKQPEIKREPDWHYAETDYSNVMHREPGKAVFGVKNTKTVESWSAQCGNHVFFYGNSEEEVTEKWNRRAEPVNEALTLDELRGMDGEPVWICSLEKNQDIINEWYQLAYELEELIAFFMFGNECEKYFKMDKYGKTWLAYRRKPEGSEG